MSKIIDQFSKDLASGMSRRRAVGRFFTGIGVAAGTLLMRKKALADENDNGICVAFCAEQELQGRDFGACVAASSQCPPGHCAFVANGGFICMPVRR